MPAGVEQRIADVVDPQQAIDAVAGAAVVYQSRSSEYTRWMDEFPALQANVADAAERAGARLVVIENLYMYGPTDGPMRETTPMAEEGQPSRAPGPTPPQPTPPPPPPHTSPTSRPGCPSPQLQADDGCMSRFPA